MVMTFALMSFPEKINMDISAINHKCSRFLGILTKLKYKRDNFPPYVGGFKCNSESVKVEVPTIPRGCGGGAYH